MSIELRHVSFDDQLIESVASFEDDEDYGSPHYWPDWVDEDCWELTTEDDEIAVSTDEDLQIINELCGQIERRIASHLAQ